MGSWAYTVTSWKGTVTPSAGNFGRMFFRRDAPGPGSVTPYQSIAAEVPGRGAIHTRAQPKPQRWHLFWDLADLNDATLVGALKDFDPDDGLQYLVITDGDGVAWRVACQAELTEVLSPFRRYTVLYVPSPVLEQNSVQTDSKLNQSGDSIAISLANVAGNRRGKPKVTITADAAKVDIYDDYGFSLRGFIVNRGAPNLLSNIPVQLFDSSGADGTIDTAAMIADVAVSNQINNGAGITAVATTIDIDTAVGGGLPTQGMGYVDTEQIRWTGNSGTQLTGVVRGIGGTTAAVHADNAVIRRSKLLANGDDVRVWIMGKEVSRTLSSINSASTRVWANKVTLPPHVPLTLKTAMTSTVPADNGELEFTDDVSELPPSGFIAIENEVIYYATRAGRKVYGVQRAVWGTTAAAHATSVSPYANPQQYVVGCGKAIADTPPASTRDKMCLNIVAGATVATNLQWIWGDAGGMFYDPDYPDRPASWKPTFEKDGNDIVPLIRLNSSRLSVNFKDDNPVGEPPYNALVMEMPHGILDNDVSAYQMDWTPSVEVLNSELHIRDISGTWKLVDELLQAAAAADRQLPAVLPSGAPGYAAKIKARYNIATGHRGTGGALALTGAGQGYRQHFTLTRETLVYGIQFYGANAGAGTESLNVWINEESHAAALGRLHFAQTIAISDAVAQVRQVLADVPVRLAPGTYCLTIAVNGAHVVNFNLGNRAGARYYHIVEDGAGALVTTQVLWFGIMTAYNNEAEAPIENDQPVRAATSGARTATIVSFDDIRIKPKYPVYVHRLSTFGQTLYHCAATISVAESGSVLGIDRWMATGSQLVIDADLRTAVHTEDGVDYSVPECLTPDDPTRWIELVPGANSITYAEFNMVQTDVVTEYRGRRG